jgi:hypothetical protein
LKSFGPVDASHFAYPSTQLLEMDGREKAGSKTVGQQGTQ